MATCNYCGILIDHGRISCQNCGRIPPLPEQALRYNEGKLLWSLVHFESLEPMVRVLEFGAQKYEKKNWMKPMDKEKILDSLMRHLAKLIDGEENDQESGLPHIGHIMCNAMFYSYHSKKHDRKIQ